LLYILFGANDFSLREHLNELKKGWGDAESLATNTTFFEASKLTPSQLLVACDATPFLCENRLVIVEGLLGRFDKKGNSAPSTRTQLNEWQIFIDHTPELPPSTQLVLIDNKVSKDNPLYKKLAPNAKVQEFPLLRGSKLQQWIYSQVAAWGGNISPRAVKLLTELAGDNLWLLSNELEKLYLYTGGRRIEDNDVQQITSYSRETNVFAMVDAIVEQRTPAAMQLLQKLLAEGMAPPYLLFMITRQLRLMVQAKDLGARVTSTAQMQEQLGLSPFYPVDQLLRQASSYSMPRLVEVYRKLLETDLGIKTGRWKGETALELLIAELSG